VNGAYHAGRAGGIGADNLSLLHRYHEADTDAERAEALAALTEKNAGLVRSVAIRYKDRLSAHNSGMDMDDLIQIGTMGMIKAARSFDFSYETTFSTYAVPLIVGEIRRYLRDDGMIKVSRDLKRRASLVLRQKEAFVLQWGRDPTVGELADALGESPQSISMLLDAASPVASLSEPIVREGDDDGYTLEHVLCAEVDEIERLTDRLALRCATEKLSQTERQILRLRYEKQLSQQQTAALLGLSQVKVSRTEKKIFAFLRAELSPK